VKAFASKPIPYEEYVLFIFVFAFLKAMTTQDHHRSSNGYYLPGRYLQSAISTPEVMGCIAWNGT
jgi:hypothetical protein